MLCELTAEWEEQVEAAWYKANSSPDFLYLDEDLHFYRDKSRLEFVSVKGDKLVGFLCAYIDANTRQVKDISIVNFSKDKSFGLDVLAFIRLLCRKFRIARWACVAGTDLEKSYEHIANMLGGRKVGVFSKKIRLMDGKLYNEAWFEVEYKK